MQEQINEIDYLERKHKNIFRRIKLRLKNKLGWLDIPKLIVYRGFSGVNTTFIAGCLTEDKGLEKPDANNSVWKNILSMINHYSSDQIPSANIKICFSDQVQNVQTNDMDIFTSEFASKNTSPEQDSKWISCNAMLQDSLGTKEKNISAKGEIFVPVTNSNFGVISDIDDTIIYCKPFHSAFA